MTNIETMIKDTLAPYPEIRLAILFGSLAAGQEHRDSDVDLTIDAGQPLEIKAKISLMEQLAECTGRPTTFDALAKLEVINTKLAIRMKKAVGFRNIAVHNYEAINWKIVHTIATSHLNDFKDFAKAVIQKCGL